MCIKGFGKVLDNLSFIAVKINGIQESQMWFLHQQKKAI